MGGSSDQKKEEGGAASKKLTKSGSKAENEDKKKTAEHQRKAEMESKIRQRVALEAKAFDVVNHLIEPGITAEFLLQACHFIDHSHYEDIVEERSISHVCGYPLCDKELRQVAKKKFHISTRSNTVYDITQRKKFCSNRCYTASEHLRKQIPDTPVWTRRGVDMEPFDLLQQDVSSPLRGEEVIGSRSLDLKEEVQQLEKLDQMEERSATTVKAKSGEPSGKPLEGTDCLSRGRESTARLAASAGSGHTSENKDKRRDRQEKLTRNGRQDDRRHVVENKGESDEAVCQDEGGGLERSLKNLTLQENQDCMESGAVKRGGMTDLDSEGCMESDVVKRGGMTDLDSEGCMESDAVKRGGMTDLDSEGCMESGAVKHGGMTDLDSADSEGCMESDAVKRGGMTDLDSEGCMESDAVKHGGMTDLDSEGCMESDAVKRGGMTDLDSEGCMESDAVKRGGMTDLDSTGSVGCMESGAVKRGGMSDILVSGHLCKVCEQTGAKTGDTLSCPVGADRGQDEDDPDCTQSREKRTELPHAFISHHRAISPTSPEDSPSVEGGRKARDADASQEKSKPKQTAMKLPGESQTDYFLRLLDSRKHQLSKVAVIQSDLCELSERSESTLDGSPHSNGTGVKADRVKSPGSDERGLGEGTKQCKDPDKLSAEKEKVTKGLEAKHRPQEKRSSVKSSKAAEPAEVLPLASVCQVISTWVSAETLDCLGLTSVQREGGSGQEGDSTCSFLTDPHMQKKYQDLCQRLAGQEKDMDNYFGEEDVEGGGDRPRGTKPVPNYQQLQRETEENQLKVQQFFTGSMTVKSKPTKTVSEAEEDNVRPIVLPDIDSHNQLLIRRRIVLERLDHTMPSLLTPLGLTIQDISAALRELVFTFSLTSHNIVLKPVEWTLAGIILLKMVESRCVAVSRAFQSPARLSAFNMVLARLDHSSASLGQLVQDMLTQHQQVTQGTLPQA